MQIMWEGTSPMSKKIQPSQTFPIKKKKIYSRMSRKIVPFPSWSACRRALQHKTAFCCLCWSLGEPQIFFYLKGIKIIYTFHFSVSRSKHLITTYDPTSRGHHCNISNKFNLKTMSLCHLPCTSRGYDMCAKSQTLCLKLNKIQSFVREGGGRGAALVTLMYTAFFLCV